MWLPRLGGWEGRNGSLGLAEAKYVAKDFPGSSVVKNPPANAGETSSIPGSSLEEEMATYSSILA